MIIETVCPACQKYITLDLDGHIGIVQGHQTIVARPRCTVCKQHLSVSITINKEDTTQCRA